jgi:hypothetical protein
VVARAATVNMLMYSPRKNIAKRIAVLGVEATDDLALALGEVEGQAVGLADHRDDVDEEAEERRDDEPQVLLRATICEVDIDPA